MSKEEKCCLNCAKLTPSYCEILDYPVTENGELTPCKYFEPKKKTLFHRITTSPAALADKLVFYEEDICMNGKVITYWTSNVIQRSYSTREEAVAATIDALNEPREKEVKDVE